MPGWPEYEVSARGQVRRSGPAKGARPGRVLEPDVHPSSGLVSVRLSRHDIVTAAYVHHLVMAAWGTPSPDPAAVVTHADGDRSNNELRNLRWASRVELAARGSRVGTSRLTEEAVAEIRESDLTDTVLAAIYGVSQSTVSRARRGRTWRHV